MEIASGSTSPPGFPSFPALPTDPPRAELAYYPDNSGSYRSGRLKDRTEYLNYPGNALISQVTAYDLLGPKQLTDQRGVVWNLTNDERGRPTTVSAQVGSPTTDWTIAYYDGKDVKSVRYPTGATACVQHDARGRASGLSLKYFSSASSINCAQDGAWTAAITYDDGGNPKLQQLLSTAGTVERFRQETKFDTDHRATTVYHPENASMTKVLDYFGDGMLKSVTDEESRITTFTQHASGVGYADVKRRDSSQGESVLAAYTPDPWSGDPAAVQDGAGSATSFGYDARSELSSVSTYGSYGAPLTRTICLKHDAAGRLALVGDAAVSKGGPDVLGCTKESDITNAATAVRFRYDGFGRRVGRRDGTGAWKLYLHDAAGNLLAEATQSGTVTREYVWLDGAPLAQLEGGATYTYHLDSTGQPLYLTNSARATVWSAVREPYGNIAETGTSVVTNLRLPGQYEERLLSSVGLQGPFYNWNRWYLPTMGRYMEPDPIAMGGGFNGVLTPEWYAYAAANPLTNVDRDGRYWAPPLPPPPPPLWPAIGVGLGIGVAARYLLPVDAWMQNAFEYWLGAPGEHNPWYAGPGKRSSNRIYPVSPRPVPSEDECDEEWARAEEACREWLGSSDPCVRRLAGGHKNVRDCAAGNVREVCGGNQLDWGPGGPFGF